MVKAHHLDQAFQVLGCVSTHPNGVICELSQIRKSRFRYCGELFAAVFPIIDKMKIGKGHHPGPPEQPVGQDAQNAE